MNSRKYSSKKCDNTRIATAAKAIRSERVVLPDGVKPACVVVHDGVIKSIRPHGEKPTGMKVNDFGDQFVLPGLVDTHIHINEPGREEWEGFETATRAAAAGGFTCVVDMPLNCIPSTTTVSALEGKRAAASGKAMVDYRFWGGAVQGNAADLKGLAKAGVAGFKSFMVHPGTEEFGMVEEPDLRAAMPLIAQCGLPLLVHAESPGPIAAASNGAGVWRDYGSYLNSRPDDSEVCAIRLLIKLCSEYQCHVHIVHLSSAKALGELRAARQQGLPITVETCPHYLYFSSELVADGNTMLKCAPPIRTKANQYRLWQALADEEIDLIATDHSPCPASMKKLETGDFRQAWGGISSVSVALAAVWTEACKRGFDMADVVRWLSESPARLANVAKAKGKIAEGYDADFAIFDAEQRWQVSPDDLHFKNKLSPYVGEWLEGRVTSTFLRGRCIYDGKFVRTFTGRECKVI